MFPAIVQRFGQQVTILTAAVIDLLVVFSVVTWNADQIAIVNLVAALVWGVIFGDGVRSLNELDR